MKRKIFNPLHPNTPAAKMTLVPGHFSESEQMLYNTYIKCVINEVIIVFSQIWHTEPKMGPLNWQQYKSLMVFSHFTLNTIYWRQHQHATYLPAVYTSAESRVMRSASPMRILCMQSRTLSPMMQLRSGLSVLAVNAMIMFSHFVISKCEMTQKRACWMGHVFSTVKRRLCSSPVIRQGTDGDCRVS